MNIRSCCFTGHRQIPLPELSPLTAQLDGTIKGLYRDGCRVFYAGGAMGFDTVAASRVLLFRARHPDVYLYLLLPCRDQTKGWPEAEAARFEEILSRSDGFRYVQEEYAPAAMTARNRALVAAADVCVAYMRRERSGTGQTVRYAKEKGMPVLNLSDRF